jgi:hypothetical protein
VVTEQEAEPASVEALQRGSEMVQSTGHRADEPPAAAGTIMVLREATSAAAQALEELLGLGARGDA